MIYDGQADKMLYDYFIMARKGPEGRDKAMTDLENELIELIALGLEARG